VSAPTKATPQQLEVLAKLANFGWVYHDTALKDGKFDYAFVLMANGNVGVLYPDGSFDRLSGTFTRLRLREGWKTYTHIQAEDRAARFWQARFHKLCGDMMLSRNTRQLRLE